MKNTDISIHDVVPIEIRKEIYKEAIELIKYGKPIAQLASFALCLTLPCLLWDLPSFLHETPQGKAWDSYDTQNMFPELTEKRVRSISRIYTDNMHTDRNIKRIEVLTEMLEKLETLLK